MRSNTNIKFIFFLSFIYTISIIALTFTITYYIDEIKIKELFYDYRYEILELNEYDITLTMMDNGIIEYISCENSSIILKKLDSEIRSLGAKLSNYGKSGTYLTEKDYDYLKRKYYLIMLKEYSLINDINSKCNNLNTGIYFFKKDHDPSLIMGQVYSELAKKINNTYILSFDIDYKDIYLLELIKQKYDITTEDAPVFIFNNECIIRGTYTLEEIINILNTKGCINK